MLLEIRGLEKRFGGARALAGASLSVAAGSVHGLIGENGAGKSTLIKTLSGLVRPDAGEIRVDGEAIAISSVREAEALGFRFIHQELSLVPQFDAVENALVVSAGLPDEVQSRLNGGLQAYLKEVIATDWPAMARSTPLDDKVYDQSEKHLLGAIDLIARQNRALGDGTSYSPLLGQLLEIRHARLA
ncbi:ATP-binding cassette domain-containing protein, partial [Devosia sp.]|uniref:ATP-binding cassette domain-containing protein n=1 Tax=Devosia sp. TaxID=1871048 RepID=UPI0025B7BAFF